MYLNPVNVAAGLLDELAGAERAGRDTTVTEVRAELRALAADALAMDLSDLDNDQKAFVADVRRRLREALGATKPTEPDEPPAQESDATATGPKQTAAAGKPPRTT